MPARKPYVRVLKPRSLFIVNAATAIRAIDISDAIGDQNQWQNAPGDLLDHSRFKRLRHVVLPKRRQLQVFRICSLGYLRSVWQVDRSRLRNVTNSCTTASQLSADWIRLIRFQMMPQLSIMRAIQVREPKRLKQATGHVQVDLVH